MPRSNRVTVTICLSGIAVTLLGLNGNRELWAIHRSVGVFQVFRHQAMKQCLTCCDDDAYELICRRGDSNPHELPHTPLKRARLPVPPLRLRLSDNDETLACCPTCQSISRLK